MRYLGFVLLLTACAKEIIRIEPPLPLLDVVNAADETIDVHYRRTNSGSGWYWAGEVEPHLSKCIALVDVGETVVRVVGRVSGREARDSADIASAASYQWITNVADTTSRLSPAATPCWPISNI